MATEIAWAAGFYDGEGSTMVQKPTARSLKPILRIAIGQADRRPLERFQQVVQAGNITGPYERKIGGSLFYWRVAGVEAHRVLDLLWPYLSEPKREQALQKRAEL